MKIKEIKPFESIEEFLKEYNLLNTLIDETSQSGYFFERREYFTRRLEITDFKELGFNAFQDEIADFGDKTFTKATIDSILNHLQRECKELIDDIEAFEYIDEMRKENLESEMADIFTLCCHYHRKINAYIYDTIRKKLEINKKRKWKEPDEHGVVEHVREDECICPAGYSINPNCPIHKRKRGF